MSAPPHPQLNRQSPTAQSTKVVIDTSAWLPALTSPRPTSHWILRQARQRAVTPIGNRETDDELWQKLLDCYVPGHGIHAYIPARRVYFLYDQLRTSVTSFPEPPAPQCEDPDNQMFIDLAYASEAALLLTRDGKLLAMNRQTPFRIIDDREARKELDPD